MIHITTLSEPEAASVAAFALEQSTVWPNALPDAMATVVLFTPAGPELRGIAEKRLHVFEPIPQRLPAWQVRVFSEALDVLVTFDGNVWRGRSVESDAQPSVSGVVAIERLYLLKGAATRYDNIGPFARWELVSKAKERHLIGAAKTGWEGEPPPTHLELTLIYIPDDLDGVQRLRTTAFHRFTTTQARP